MLVNVYNHANNVSVLIFVCIDVICIYLIDYDMIIFSTKCAFFMQISLTGKTDLSIYLFIYLSISIYLYLSIYLSN